MIFVTSTLQLWAGDNASWHFISILADEGAEIRAHSFANPRSFGSVKVEASIGEVKWRTSVFPQKAGGYLLPVKAEVRRRARIAAGDSVSVKLNLI